MSAKGKKRKKAQPRETALQQLLDYGTAALAAIYVFLMLCVYPLYYQDRYYEIGVAKYLFFERVTLGLGGLTAAAALARLISDRERRKPRKLLRSFSVCDWMVIAYGALCVLSYLCSSYRAVESGGGILNLALYGYDGWRMGLISQLLFVLIYFVVSRCWSWSPLTLIGAAVAAGIAYQIGILQRFGFNPLGLYDGLGAEYIEKFLSTIGQSSWYTSYAVLIVPLGLYFYLWAHRLWTRLLSAFFIALGFGMIGTSNSDSAYVAIVLIYMVLFCYALAEEERLLRFLETALLGVGALLTIGILRRLFPGRRIELITGEERITEFATGSLAAWGVFLLLLALYLLLCWQIRKKKPALRIAPWREPIWRITLTAAALTVWAVVMLVILTSRRRLPGFLTGLYDVEFMNFNDAWGNHRGFNWRMALRALSRASWKDILIGTGPDTFYGAMNTYCREEVAAYWHGIALVCAHNEWLNMLVTGGIAGTAAYLGIFFSALQSGMRVSEREPAAVPLIAAVAAYLGHNIFCYQQCVCTPVIFIMMGILRMICGSGQKEAAG